MSTSGSLARAMGISQTAVEAELDQLCNEHPLVQQLADFADRQVDQISDLEADRQALQLEITDLKTDRQALQTEIKELNWRIAELEEVH